MTGRQTTEKIPNRREELMSSEEKKNAAKRKWFITNRMVCLRYT